MTVNHDPEFLPAVSAQAPAVVSLATRIAASTVDSVPEVLGLKMAVSRYDGATIAPSVGKEILVSFEDVTGTGIDYSDIPHADLAVIFRAVDTLRDELGRAREISGVDIVVQKLIPFEAHLGGRGATAAAVLVALAGLWMPTMAREDLIRVAHRIGPDVAAAMIGGTLLTHQTGNEHVLTHVLVRDPLALVLVPAAAEISDTELWQTVRDLGPRHRDDDAPLDFSPELLQAVNNGDAQQVALLIHNDFQPALVQLLPDHHDWLTAGMAAGALAAQTVDRGASLLFIAQDPHHGQVLAEGFAARMEIAAVAETGPVSGAHLVKS